MYGLSRTLESIFAQTWHDYELIVIDGGSTDGSAELIEENAGRIAYRVSEKDRGDLSRDEQRRQTYFRGILPVSQFRRCLS